LRLRKEVENELEGRRWKKVEKRGNGRREKVLVVVQILEFGGQHL